MPKLLLFAPCLKAIADADDRTLTVVSALVGLNVNLAPGIEMPSTALVPLTWSAAALWRRIPSDLDQWFEMRIWLDVPGQGPFIDVHHAFQMVDLSHHFKFQTSNFPVGVPGDIVLRLAIRVRGEEDWAEAAEYPLIISHLTE
jgi:hypothetical protein